MAGRVLSDASPLIGLARVDGLGWLNALFGVVWVPREVRDEVLSGRELPDEQKILAAFAQGGLRVCERTPAKPELPDLDEGEVACIRLALADTTPALLLMDELAGRAIEKSVSTRIKALQSAETAPSCGLLRGEPDCAGCPTPYPP